MIMLTNLTDNPLPLPHGQTIKPRGSIRLTEERWKKIGRSDVIKSMMRGGVLLVSAGIVPDGDEPPPIAMPDDRFEKIDLPTYSAVHRGGGVYAIMNDGEVVHTGLTKTIADAFNDLDDAGRAEKVSEYFAAR